MAKLKVTAPEKEKFTGEIAGVAFVKGIAEVDEGEHARALAYFRRRGYTVEKVREAAAPADAGGPADEGGKKPARSASKADWVAYATSPEGGITQDEADAMTRDQLADKFLGPKPE